MRKIIGVLSGKGGVGKTTVVVNLGYAMHKLGENIIIVDGDLRNPNMGLHLGSIEHYTTLQDVLEKDIPLLEALYIHETGLRFIPAHLSLSYLNTDPSRLRNVFSSFDYNVLLDAPSGLEKGALSVLEACDEAIIVTTPSLPDITDCLKTIEVARKMNVVIDGIILNNVRKKKYEIKKKEIEAITNVKILKTIPWDENILKSLTAKTPVIEKNPISPASISFMEIASDMCDKEYKKPKFLGLKRLFLKY